MNVWEVVLGALFVALAALAMWARMGFVRP